MATKLKTRDENLNLLLAQIRYPLIKCIAKFHYVCIVNKQEITTMFEQVLQEYNLAADMVVYGAIAVYEVVSSTRRLLPFRTV